MPMPAPPDPFIYQEPQSDQPQSPNSNAKEKEEVDKLRQRKKGKTLPTRKHFNIDEVDMEKYTLENYPQPKEYPKVGRQIIVMLDGQWTMVTITQRLFKNSMNK